MSRAKDSNGMKPLDGQLDIVEELDTNQASELYELYELCKEVYEKTGWEAPETYKAEDGNPDNDWQAYDTDYLLEKLPKYIDKNMRYWFSLEPHTDNEHWEAVYQRADGEGYYFLYAQTADTPLKALLKLTIALSEAGELK